MLSDYLKKRRAERVERKILRTLKERAFRVDRAFHELMAAVSATHLTPEDFPEATALGLDVLHWQKVMDGMMGQYLGQEVLRFFAEYEEARQRDLAAKASVWNRRRDSDTQK